ncbi:hypothetical protein [Prosthecomicrobium pneumaticum]|uniref:Uncharacterized membrane protein YidH (DUF202 family) n=1 Tax=Prosthecomicrobium pneumaticum TaxID=81895 RepID=A0A7W9FLE8_9HYPH|nr:hypothetical protein [Prosthecomicrobium pneumaticum]MBB5752820.1 uncharacterized membrane protein YidH (DUF202 family) [Prosthecomicrobium pneumaticum]
MTERDTIDRRETLLRRTFLAWAAVYVAVVAGIAISHFLTGPANEPSPQQLIARGHTAVQYVPLAPQTVRLDEPG